MTGRNWIKILRKHTKYSEGYWDGIMIVFNALIIRSCENRRVTTTKSSHKHLITIAHRTKAHNNNS